MEYLYRLFIDEKEFATNLTYDQLSKTFDWASSKNMRSVTYGIIGKKNDDGSYTHYPVKEYPKYYMIRNNEKKVKHPVYDLTDNGKGKKYDGGKSMVGTMINVFPHALMAVGKCIEFGTHKYPNPNNWKMVEGADKRYQDSLMRHLIKHNAGQVLDEETNLLHLAHAAWNALAILELYIMNDTKLSEEYLK